MNDVRSESLPPDAALVDALRRAKLIGSTGTPAFERLTGGVSSDIWKVTTPTRTFCVKRALSRLRVAAEWHAPVARNRFEVAWYRTVHEILPNAVPRVLCHDEQEMLCAMSYLDPLDHKLWKSELRDGRALAADAAAVGLCLVRIHAATYKDSAVFERFPANGIFHAIRLHPYLEATAEAHPDLRDQLLALSRRTAATRSVMIHGDVSPKNILLGPRGPVFLDAECACIGDPAFDLAFCLNHLLLKCLWNPSSRDAYLDCFQALAQAYLSAVDWEPAETLEARVASLLAGLLLARVDGKSPVEYIVDDADRDHVRHCARTLLKSPPLRLAEILRAWRQGLNA